MLRASASEPFMARAFCVNSMAFAIESLGDRLVPRNTSIIVGRTQHHVGFRVLRIQGNRFLRHAPGQGIALPIPLETIFTTLHEFQVGFETLRAFRPRPGLLAAGQIHLTSPT